MKRILNKVLIFVFSAVLLFSSGITALLKLPMTTTFASELALTFSTDFLIQDSYTYKDVVIFPSLSEVKLSEQPATQVVLIAPDGKVITAEGKVQLNQVGDYIYRVYANVDNKPLYKDVKFNVQIDTFSFEGESSIEYGELTSSISHNDTEISEGVKVSLAIGDTLSYNKPIKLSDLDTINNIITFKEYNDDAFNMYITLTDVYDANNTVEFNYRVNKNDSGKRSFYVLSSFNNTELIGFNRVNLLDSNAMSSSKTYLTYDDPYRETADDYYGEGGLTTAKKSGRAATVTGDVEVEHPKGSGNWIKVDASKVVQYPYTASAPYYLKEDVEVGGVTYKSECKGSNVINPADGTDSWPRLANFEVGSVSLSASNYITFNYNTEKQLASYGLNRFSSSGIINDFKLTEYYGENKFDGFTDNLVYLTISVERNGSSGIDFVNFEIADIAGDNAEGKFDDYKVSDDESAPEISVDFSKQVAYAAQNCAFPIPSYKALDPNLKESFVEVFYNYGKANESVVLNDGKSFIPTSVGRYTVVYNAVDTYGNISKRELSVYCVKTPSGKMVDTVLGQEVFDGLVARAGYPISLPSVKEMGISSINGFKSCEVVAVYNGEEYSIDQNNSVFSTSIIGDWQIVYKVTDGLTTFNLAFDLYVGSSAYVGIIEEPTYPKYIIKNAPYEIEDIEVYSFLGGKKLVDAELSIRYDGAGDFVKFDDNVIEKVAGEQYLELQYTFDGVVVYSKQLPIMDVGFGDLDAFDLAKYFVGGNFEKNANSENVFLKSNVTSGSNGFEFINFVDSSKFVLEFNNNVGREAFDYLYENKEEYPDGYFANYTTVKVILTDYYDFSNKVEIKFVKNASITAMYVDGVAAASSAPNFDEGVKLTYSFATKSFVAGKAKVEKELPFVSPKCYFEVVLEGITGESAIAITKINNEYIYNSYTDSTNPEVNLGRDASAQVINTIYTLESPWIIDVLSPVLSSGVQLTVTMPSGGYVSSVDGVILNGAIFDRNFDFKLTEYGDYRIRIVCKDVSDCQMFINMTITVAEKDVPSIEFTDGTEAGDILEYKVGDTVTFKSVEGYDNVEGVLTPRVFVMEPHELLYAPKGSTYIPNKAGIYKIIYRVETADGRFSTTYYYLDVK